MRDRFSMFGYCRACFRGDRIDPPAMCSECERDAEEEEEAAELQARDEELDDAFEQLVWGLNHAG